MKKRGFMCARLDVARHQIDGPKGTAPVSWKELYGDRDGDRTRTERDEFMYVRRHFMSW